MGRGVFGRADKPVARSLFFFGTMLRSRARLVRALPGPGEGRHAPRELLARAGFRIPGSGSAPLTRQPRADSSGRRSSSVCSRRPRHSGADARPRSASTERLVLEESRRPRAILLRETGRLRLMGNPRCWVAINPTSRTSRSRRTIGAFGGTTATRQTHGRRSPASSLGVPVTTERR